MIELRWLYRERGRDEMTADEWSSWCAFQNDPEPGPIRETILQYRVFRTHRLDGDDRHTHATPLADWAQEWSEWMDVPKVVRDLPFAAVGKDDQK